MPQWCVPRWPGCTSFRQVPVQLAVPGAAGHNRWGVAETPLPAKTQGRTRDAVFNVVSFKPERAFKVIAHVRDWEHAGRRCLWTVRGFALHAECTGPGRHVGESTPGPTGLMWASELSEPRHAQAERPPTERSGARACWFQRQETSGRQPENWLSAGTPYDVVGHWYESYAVGTGLGSDRKYVVPRQVEQRDPLRSGLVLPVSDGSLEEWQMRKKSSRRDSAGSKAVRGGKPTEATQQLRDRAVQRTRARACLCLSSVTVAGPSGPGQSDHASMIHTEFPSRVAKGRVAAENGTAAARRTSAARADRAERPAECGRAEPTNAADTCRAALTERLDGRASAVSREHLAKRSGERALTSRGRRRAAQIRAGGIRSVSVWWLVWPWYSGSLGWFFLVGLLPVVEFARGGVILQLFLVPHSNVSVVELPGVHW